ncbi:MAG: nuclear transport factor 2 family protein [Bdellovibrionales bacterium]|nr:nuclear transport factor 2 family protein [Bdellovibrionales bacterium]
MKQIEAVKKYIQLVQDLNFTEESTAGLLHRDYLQWELPNLLNKQGQKSGAADSFRRMLMAKEILQSQCYEITSILEQGSTVVMESTWVGTLKNGQVMKAFFCMYFEFLDGKIHRVRNYDCFVTG